MTPYDQWKLQAPPMDPDVREDLEDHLDDLYRVARRSNPKADEIKDTIIRLHKLLEPADKITREMAALSIAITLHEIDGLMEYVDDWRFSE